MVKYKRISDVLFDLIDERPDSGYSKNAELLIRRMLDKLSRSEDGRFPNSISKLYYAIGNSYSISTFKRAWQEVQFKGFEVFTISEDGIYIEHTKLTAMIQHKASVSKKRAIVGRKGGKKNE